jgi:hypothetical protein
LQSFDITYHREAYAWVRNIDGNDLRVIMANNTGLNNNWIETFHLCLPAARMISLSAVRFAFAAGFMRNVDELDFSEMRHSNRLLIRNSQENIFGPITNPYNAFVQFFFNDMDKPNNNRLYQSIRNRSYPGRGLDCSYEPRERNPTINYHLAQPYTTLFKIRFHTSATTMILQDSI